MHREIQIKQFPIVTTHWWPKTRNERFVWENEQYLYRFLPLVHNHVQVIWVRTRIRCVTCVCVRSGSRCIHTGRRRQCLTEGVSEAWCWRAVIVTTTNHILLWCCMNGIGYLHEAIWLADASVGAWKVASAPRFRHALRQLVSCLIYTCHYMTDRLERFDLKTSKLDLLKKKRHLHLGCPWGKLIDTKF